MTMTTLEETYKYNTYDHVDDSTVVEDSTSIVDDPLLESSTLIIVKNILIPYIVTSDIINELVQSNTHTPTEIYVYKKSTNDVQDAFVKSSTHMT